MKILKTTTKPYYGLWILVALFLLILSFFLKEYLSSLEKPHYDPDGAIAILNKLEPAKEVTITTEDKDGNQKITTLKTTPLD